MKLLLIVFLFIPQLALSKMSGTDIATSIYNVNDGTSLRAKMEMAIFKRGKLNKTRRLELFRIDDGKNDRSLLRICFPSLLSGTSFLSWNHRHKENYLWIYLPSKKKSRRISVGSKYQKFVASDFTYDDLSKFNLSENRFKRLPDEKKFYVVESIPKNKQDKVTKRVFWAHKNNFMIHKIEYYDGKNELFKKLMVEEIKKIQGIWTITKSKMINLKRKSETHLTMSDIKYNQKISKMLFTSKKLKQRCGF